MVFKNIWILFLIPVVLPILYFFYRQRQTAAFRFSSTDQIKQIHSTWKLRLIHLPFAMRVLVMTLFIVALAGPRLVSKQSVVTTEGIEIVLAIDVSGSMAAEDFTIKNQRVNRLDVVKDVVKQFIDMRENDRIGLIAFAGVAVTISPLTTDYNWVKNNVDRFRLGMLQDHTAIGSAIASSVARLKDSEAKSKIVILLTDGENNAGTIEPLKAAQIAKTYDIKIYTIGAGTKGFAPYPVMDPFGRKRYQNVPTNIDEKTLTEIATITGGSYFRATDTKSLQDIYEQINKLEKTEIQEIGYFEYKELFVYFTALALILLILEIILSHTVLLRVP